MRKAVGHAANTPSDAAEKTGQSGKYGTARTSGITNTRRFGTPWRTVDDCGECRQPLEEWEAGICEGCGIVKGES